MEHHLLKNLVFPGQNLLLAKKPKVKVGWDLLANQVELDWYEQRFNLLAQSPELDQVIEAMTDIHHAIWDLEWQLKSGVEQMLSLQEIGRRAIAIRDFNNRRIAYKNSVASILGHAVKEIKQDHLADGTVDYK